MGYGNTEWDRYGKLGLDALLHLGSDLHIQPVIQQSMNRNNKMMKIFCDL
jgi:hypothetical protein